MRHLDFVVGDVRRHRSGPPLWPSPPSHHWLPFVSDFHLDLQCLSEVFDDVASLPAVSLLPTAGKAKRCQSFSDRPRLLQTGTLFQVETLSLTFSASPVIWIAILSTVALPHVVIVQVFSPEFGPRGSFHPPCTTPMTTRFLRGLPVFLGVVTSLLGKDRLVRSLSVPTDGTELEMPALSPTMEKVTPSKCDVTFGEMKWNREGLHRG